MNTQEINDTASALVADDKGLLSKLSNVLQQT